MCGAGIIPPAAIAPTVICAPPRTLVRCSLVSQLIQVRIFPMSNVPNLIGKVFGRLTVLERSAGKWVCSCSCGGTHLVQTERLNSGHTKSCGCLKKTQKANLNHGYCVDGKVRSEYWAWHNAKRRCTETTRHNFHRYGGRNISMCQEWFNDFGAFIAHIGPKPPGMTLDRIDNNRGYEPGNVRWATYSQQAFNRNKYPPRKPQKT